MRSLSLRKEREKYLNGLGKKSKMQLKRSGLWEDHLKELKKKRAEDRKNKQNKCL